MYFYIFKLRMQQYKEVNIKQINIYMKFKKFFYIQLSLDYILLFVKL